MNEADALRMLENIGAKQMSDAETDERQTVMDIPQTEVARPDIPPPRVDSLGRSMAKKRGRPPGSVNKANASATTEQLKAEIAKRLPTNAILSDENVGKALAGAFAAIGLFRGGHWRLFAHEEKELGEAFGPLARLHGPEELTKWVTALMMIPVVSGILMPRVAVERMIMQGDIKKEEARSTLLQIHAFTEAEKQFSVQKAAADAKQAADYLRAQATVGATVAEQFKTEEEKEDVLNGH